MIALGVLLPSMHQSSLGSLLVVFGYQIHPLWQTILLPLLPMAARALANYLKDSRPKPCRSRQVFIRAMMPFGPFAGSTVIRYMLTKYGRKAGVTTGCLGSHVLRHSQATRQVELGTPLKVVGDILGHRDPEDTSHYTRSAIRRLRDLALPLPHD